MMAGSKISTAKDVDKLVNDGQKLYREVHQKRKNDGGVEHLSSSEVGYLATSYNSMYDSHRSWTPSGGDVLYSGSDSVSFT